MISVEEILTKLSPNQKVNYDKVFQKMAASWQSSGIRPKLLMHVCCAPCSTYTLEYLTQYADVTIYFANSNIHPKAEYQRRAAVTAQFVSDFNQISGQTVGYLEADYSPQEFFKKPSIWLMSQRGETVARYVMIFVWTRLLKRWLSLVLTTLVRH